MLLEARSGRHPTAWLGMGGLATLASYGPGRDLALIPDEHYRFLESCLDFHETESHIFVHANYFPDLPMAEQPVEMLRWESLREMTPGPHESGKTVILGHTSQKRGEILDLGHLKCIDTYCYGGGWLTAIDVQVEEVWQADREGNCRG
jgi:serine/threonine protein phosphatase 1